MGKYYTEDSLPTLLESIMTIDDPAPMLQGLMEVWMKLDEGLDIEADDIESIFDDIFENSTCVDQILFENSTTVDQL